MLSDEISGPMFVTVNFPTTRLPPSTGQYCYPRKQTHITRTQVTRIIRPIIRHSSKYDHFCATTHRKLKSVYNKCQTNVWLHEGLYRTFVKKISPERRLDETANLQLLDLSWIERTADNP